MSSSDDFDKMVRHMFERFFKNAFGPDSNGEGMIRFGFQPPTVENEIGLDIPKENENHVEKIDFGDSMLIVVDGDFDDDKLSIRIEAGNVIIDTELSSDNRIQIEIPFTVDLAKSGYSCRNGILEIRLAKSDMEKMTKTISEGILQKES